MATRGNQAGCGSSAAALLGQWGDTAVRRGRPVWLELGRAAGGRPLTVEVQHPDGLLGRVVGPDRDAVGMVATGRVRSTDPGVEVTAGLARAHSGGARVACLLTRAGHLDWHMVLPDGSTLDSPPQEGRMLDVLRRSLGLATAPPAEPFSRLEVCAWLVGALRLGEAVAPRRLTWPEIEVLRPAGPVDRCPTDGPAAWEAARRLVAAGRVETVCVSAALAGWMDAGMFSRWVVDSLAEPDEIVAALRPYIDPVARKRLIRTVHHFR